MYGVDIQKKVCFRFVTRTLFVYRFLRPMKIQSLETGRGGKDTNQSVTDWLPGLETKMPLVTWLDDATLLE